MTLSRKTVRYLAQSFPELIDEVDSSKRTPAHYAALSPDGGHVFNILKRLGADLTVKDKLGQKAADYLKNQTLLTKDDVVRLTKTNVLDRLAASDDKFRQSSPHDSPTSHYGSGEEEQDIGESVGGDIEKVEELYETLQRSDSQSLLKKFLTRKMFNELKTHRRNDSSLYNVIISGLMHPDSSIGVYATDPDDYAVFNSLFDPILNEYHIMFGPSDKQPSTDYGDLDLIEEDLNDLGDFILSTRISISRSLEGYPFAPKMSEEQFVELERDIEAALGILDGDLAGSYKKLADLNLEESEELSNLYLLFSDDNKYLSSVGSTKFWPKGRGIFLSGDKNFAVWVNEEDHVKIISTQQGGDLKAVYKRLVKANLLLERRLSFRHSTRLGYLIHSPVNLGTSLRSSVFIKIPKLSKVPDKLKAIAEQYHLNIKAKNSDYKGRVIDKLAKSHRAHIFDQNIVKEVSNRRRLGVTEIEAVQDMYEGVQELIRAEMQLDVEDDRNTYNNAINSKIESNAAKVTDNDEDSEGVPY